MTHYKEKPETKIEMIEIDTATGSKRPGYLMTFGPQKKSSKILEYLMNLVDRRRNKIKRYVYDPATEKYTEVDAYGVKTRKNKLDNR